MRVATVSDKGMVRKVNQDNIFASSGPVGGLPNLYVVADGMGGEKAGGCASKCTIRYLVEYLQNNSSTGNLPASLLVDGIDYANFAVYEKASKNGALKGMGTTIVAASIVDRIMYVCNVGDSRLYLVNNNIKQITRDHSYVEEMVLKGLIDRNSEEYRKNKNLITRAVGVKKELNIDVFEVDLEKDDIVLLCSDGLTNMISDEDIFKIIKGADSLEGAVRKLVGTANCCGGMDNISVILAAYGTDEVAL